MIETENNSAAEGEQFITSSLPRLRIAVIGDVMLDRYVFGKVSRISPEAPVPVNLVESERSVPGGAANTAANLSAMGVCTELCGLCGNDESGRRLFGLLEQRHIGSSGILTVPGFSTTAKMRILGSRQQMLRLDFEEKRTVSEEEKEHILQWLEACRGKGLDSIILSDYGKGVVTDSLAQAVIKAGEKWDIPVLVDPKGSDWTRYTGASAVTPNLNELSQAVGKTVKNEDGEVGRAAEFLRDKFKLRRLFVTRSEKGITCAEEGAIFHCPAMAQDVFDVSGAGDTVMAVLAAGCAAGIGTETLLRLANTAAGVVVAKVGTYSIHGSEFLSAWTGANRRAPVLPEIFSWKEAASYVKEWQKRGEKVVFTNGCFDILHRGHITYLQQAAALGDHLLVGLNADSSVRKLKGPSRPVNNEQDRAFLLASLRCVDGVVLFEEDTPAELLSVLRPDILVKGGDYQTDEVAGREFAGRTEILPFVEGYSTSCMIDRIRGEKL
jgi:D-beta-D-heptose 7-phosphate kinase/D-beta-D-heptose 1-phosphate adenosyltransferase